jgi:SAM-dependent methyltransferase
VEHPGVPQDGIQVGYVVADHIEEATAAVDLVISQAVLEHVDDLEQVYASIHAALRPGGCMSHTIDFTSHHFARDWNGHWTFSDRVWTLIKGRRRYAINREPLSTHLRLIEAAGFDVVSVLRSLKPSPIGAAELVPSFRSISPEDMETASAIVQAVKRP